MGRKTPDQTLFVHCRRAAYRIEDPIDLIRQGKPQTVYATVGERPSEDKLRQFGQDPDQDFSQPNKQDNA